MPSCARICRSALALHLDRFAQAFAGESRAGRGQPAGARGGAASRMPARWQAQARSGALRELQRLCRRRHRYGRGAWTRRSRARRAELEARAAARGITSPGTLEAPSAELLAATLYRDAVAGANASLVVARAVAVRPEHAGHYNPVRVASRALEALSDHPAYLRAQLARLEVVALLQELKTAGNRGRPQRRPRR